MNTNQSPMETSSERTTKLLPFNKYEIHISFQLNYYEINNKPVNGSHLKKRDVEVLILICTSV